MLPIMGAYWITLAFFFFYIIVYAAIFEGELGSTPRSKRNFKRLAGASVIVVIVGSLVGVWMSALIPGLYA